MGASTRNSACRIARFWRVRACDKVAPSTGGRFGAVFSTRHTALPTCRRAFRQSRQSCQSRHGSRAHVPQKIQQILFSNNQSADSGHMARCLAWQCELHSVRISCRAMVCSVVLIPAARCTRSSPLTSTRILGRRTAPIPSLRIPNRVPHGFTQGPSTEQRGLQAMSSSTRFCNPSTSSCCGWMQTSVWPQAMLDIPL